LADVKAETLVDALADTLGEKKPVREDEKQSDIKEECAE